MVIVLHSSKTMRRVPAAEQLQQPALIDKAQQLAAYMRTLSPATLASIMKISPALAAKTHQGFAQWTNNPSDGSAAIDSFVGDIYSGLRATELSSKDREYAQQHLRILSGLYGILRPFDSICAYRLEMGYRLPDEPFQNLYAFWGKDIAQQLPESGPVLNIAALEYSKTFLPFIDPSRIITPKFLTVDPKTQEPKFVVVHAKIARGALARWAIQNRVTSASQLVLFDDIGYSYNAQLSSPQEPVFVCQEFGGKGLSMRLA